MGIQVTRSILPCPYNPGPNGAGEGVRGAQGRCPSCALHTRGLQHVPSHARPLHPPWHEEHAGGFCNMPSTAVVPTWPLRPPPALGGGQLGVPTGSPQPSTGSLALRYLPRSPLRRTPAAAGLQAQHGPAVLPAAPGTDASPASSGKGSLCPVLPGARLPSPRSAQPQLPWTRQPGLCFHGRALLSTCRGAGDQPQC